MTRKKIRRLPVKEGDDIVGIVSDTDIFAAVEERGWAVELDHADAASAAPLQSQKVSGRAASNTKTVATDSNESMENSTSRARQAPRPRAARKAPKPARKAPQPASKAAARKSALKPKPGGRKKR
jgi:CBS domain-containing protein